MYLLISNTRKESEEKSTFEKEKNLGPRELIQIFV